MADKVIPIQKENSVRDYDAVSLMRLPVPITGEVRLKDGRLLDARLRPLRDLRISITDHCNFRCRYCMPKEKFDDRHQFLAHTELLSFEELVRLVRIFIRLGIEKVRLTGGEPLLRKHVEELIAELKTLVTCTGKPLDIAMTTNGSLLKRLAPQLKAAGLDRVTVSLDALDEDLFQSINDVGFPAGKVLEGIEAAVAAGIPLKVNTVLKRGMNEKEIIPLVEKFRGTGIILRFIEYMDAGTANGWRMDDVISSAEVVEIIRRVHPIEPIQANYRGETASRWRYVDGAGEIGFISSVSNAFCRDCSRVRLSVEGALVMCLFADRGYDLRTMLRGGATDEEIALAIARLWSARNDHYSEIRLSQTSRPRAKVEMQYIGG